MIDISKCEIRKMRENENVKSFDCGDEDLNSFIINDAGISQQNRLTVSYIVQYKDTVVAYFSLAFDKISIRDFPDKTTFNRFRKAKFANSKRFRSYPSAKICRLAVDLSASRMNIGTRIINFIKSSFAYKSQAGCRFLTVDAYMSAIGFYKKNDFKPLFQTDGDAETQLMFYDLMALKQ